MESKREYIFGLMNEMLEKGMISPEEFDSSMNFINECWAGYQVAQQLFDAFEFSYKVTGSKKNPTYSIKIKERNHKKSMQFKSDDFTYSMMMYFGDLIDEEHR